MSLPASHSLSEGVRVGDRETERAGGTAEGRERRGAEGEKEGGRKSRREGEKERERVRDY